MTRPSCFAILTLVAAAAFGCDKNAHDAVPAPVGSGTAAAAAPMTVSLRAARVEAGETALAPGDRARDGDRLVYYLTADRDAHAYVLQYFPDGTRQVVYPPSGAGAPVRAQTETRVPPLGQWLELYGCPGPESVVLVVSEEPLGRAEPELEAMVGRVRLTPPAAAADCPAAPGAAAPSAALAGSTSAGPSSPSASASPAPPTSSGTRAAAPTRGVRLPGPETTAFAGELGNLRSRVLKLGGSSLQSTADERGVAVVVFDFEHVPRDAP